MPHRSDRRDGALFEQVGNETLKYWLAYWRDDSRSPDGDDRGPRECHIGKIEAELRARGRLDEPGDASARKARPTRPRGDDEAATPERQVAFTRSRNPRTGHGAKGLTSPAFDGVGTPDLRYWLSGGAHRNERPMVPKRRGVIQSPSRRRSRPRSMLANRSRTCMSMRWTGGFQELGGRTSADRGAKTMPGATWAVAVA